MLFLRYGTLLKLHLLKLNVGRKIRLTITRLRQDQGPRLGLCLHAAAIKTGTQHDTYTSNHILNMYAKCGKIGSARKLFDEMSERNLITWSAMVSGYDQAGQPQLALTLYSKMLVEHEHIKPNEFIFASTLSSCARFLALPAGQQIHAQTVKLGYDSVLFVLNSLISMYMKCGKCSDALSVFERVDSPSCVSYNAIISGLVENGKEDEGFEMLKLMCQQGLVPDRFTFVGLLGGSFSSNDLWRGMVLHCQTIKLNLDATAFVGNVIIMLYAKLVFMEEAEKVFRLIKEKDVISWNTFIAACSNCNDHVKALSVFREMVTVISVRPDNFTYANILSVCAGVASIRLGKEIHAHLIRRRPDSDLAVGNALVNMYAKCGCIGHAYTVFNLMPHRNLVSWNSIIAGFANHGLGGKALEIFKQMKDKGLKPDSVTFLELLTACNHAGLVDEGILYFNSMTDYGISHDIEHFSCLIDLLGRAGRLNEAEFFMQKYPFGNDPVVLGCLLSASRLHGDVIVGERLARRILKLQPVSTSPYVLLSNLFASDGMWDGVAEARKMLKGSGLKKEPGQSLIDVKGFVEEFTIGDFSHSRIEEIVDILRTLSWKGEEELLSN